MKPLEADRWFWYQRCEALHKFDWTGYQMNGAIFVRRLPAMAGRLSYEPDGQFHASRTAWSGIVQRFVRIASGDFPGNVAAKTRAVYW